MGNESGTWIMYGLPRDDPRCIRTVKGAIAYIHEVGFLPLFKNGIEGFSLEERTAPEDWWCEDPKRDPWIFRQLIARGGEVAYGKFFDQKAGFISKEWFPYFANYRRDGYDFDALWEDEKASLRQKKIMDLFMQERSPEETAPGEMNIEEAVPEGTKFGKAIPEGTKFREAVLNGPNFGENVPEGSASKEYFSYEVRKLAGFGKGGEKGFEGTVTKLQMQTYLCIRDFRQRTNRKGENYGWPIALYCTPEHLWGYAHISSAYGEEPEVSGERILLHMRNLYPSASETELGRMLGFHA